MKKITLLISLIFVFSATYLLANNTEYKSKSITATADSVDLNDYVGKFKLADGSPVESVLFLLKDGKLVGQAGEYPETTLSIKSKDIFTDSENGGIFTFIRTDGKINKIKIEVAGLELFGEKVVEDKK